MKFNTIRVNGMLATAIVIAIAGAVEASVQTADVAGAWTFTEPPPTGTSTPAVRLKQDGETLTGHYSSENLGEAQRDLRDAGYRGRASDGDVYRGPRGGVTVLGFPSGSPSSRSRMKR